MSAGSLRRRGAARIGRPAGSVFPRITCNYCSGWAWGPSHFATGARTDRNGVTHHPGHHCSAGVIGCSNTGACSEHGQDAMWAISDFTRRPLCALRASSAGEALDAAAQIYGSRYPTPYTVEIMLCTVAAV